LLHVLEVGSYGVIFNSVLREPLRYYSPGQS
jgi:hypothetical protein